MTHSFQAARLSKNCEQLLVLMKSVDAQLARVLSSLAAKKVSPPPSGELAESSAAAAGTSWAVDEGKARNLTSSRFDGKAFNIRMLHPEFRMSDLQNSEVFEISVCDG